MKKILTFKEITKNFDGFLFDAYGVLVDDSGLLPGAVAALEHLRDVEKPYLMLSNGSSRTVADTAKRYRELGLNFTDEQVITSGGMLQSFLQQNTESDDRFAVMGTAGSFELLKEARRTPIALLEAEGNFDYLVIANQTEFPFLESVDEALTQICRKLDSGKSIQIILTNPDLFYPKKEGHLGITAGSIAEILEASLKARYGMIPPELFVRLGKPFAPMFDEAKKRLQSGNLLMIGDQIYTDIKGAKEAKISSLLLGSGLTHFESVESFPDNLQPDFFLETL